MRVLCTTRSFTVFDLMLQHGSRCTVPWLSCAGSEQNSGSRVHLQALNCALQFTPTPTVCVSSHRNEPGQPGQGAQVRRQR